MSGRRYRQHCALAKSLDVLGDRWTLLVVRELLDGPQRYVDLLEGLATISTDVLAARLKDLEHHGLVVRRQLPKPAASWVYELTPAGAELEPVIDAYIRWGRRLIEERDPDDLVRLPWLARAVRTLLRPDREGVRLTLALRTPEGRTAMLITDDRVEALGAEAAAEVTLTGRVEDLAAALDPARVPPLVAAGRLVVDGDPDQVRRLATLFR